MARISPAARLAAQSQQGNIRVDSLQLSGSIVPMTGASMRILESVIALAAIGTALLLGLIH